MMRKTSVLLHGTQSSVSKANGRQIAARGRTLRAPTRGHGDASVFKKGETMTFVYCPKCGKKLDEKEIGDEGLAPFCNSCNKVFLSFSYPCVLCVVINENNEVALIKQDYVSKNYVTVAGFISQGETVEDCAKREVEEELGLAVTEAKYYTNYYHEKRDLLMFGVICKVQNGSFNISKEVDTAIWFSPEEAIALVSNNVIQDMIKEYFKIR